jgi:hypothetical protein
VVADKLRRFPLPFLEQIIDYAFERIDQQLVAVDGLFLQNGFADVEDMAGVHPVDAVQLNVFRRYFEDGLHRLFGVNHFLHQLQEGGILTGVIHGRGNLMTVDGGWKSLSTTPLTGRRDFLIINDER